MDMDEQERFYGQAGQDAFVCRLCNAIANRGVFVDLGAGHPRDGSNTFVLESRHDWEGIVADIATKDQLLEHRTADVFGDAFDPEVDKAILKWAEVACSHIDYLSLDLEPPELTLKRLLTLPLHEVRFGIITCEHDLYRDKTGSIKAAMEGILTHHGYNRVAENVRMMADIDGHSCLVPVEDWWIHPAIHEYRRAWAIANEVLDHVYQQQIAHIQMERAK